MNKYQDALKIVSGRPRMQGFAAENKKDLKLSMLRELVEKATPRKPAIFGDGYDDEGELIYDMYDCPNCNRTYELDYEKYDYCPNCGQALDWSDDNA